MLPPNRPKVTPLLFFAFALLTPGCAGAPASATAAGKGDAANGGVNNAASHDPSSAAPGGDRAAPPGAAMMQGADPVAAALTVSGVTAMCDDGLARARALLEAIASLDGGTPAALTYAATVGRFDEVFAAVGAANDVPYLIQVVHPDAAVRDAAKECEPKADAFTTGVWLDARVGRVIRAYSAKGDQLEGERGRLLRDVLRDFRRNGLELSPQDQTTLRTLNEALSKVGQAFSVAIAESKDSIEVKPAQLAGLPREYVAAHAPNARGLVTITTDYPDYHPFVTYATDRKAALDLYVAFVNRGGDENVRRVEQLLDLRARKARLLGYANWAEYAVEPRMAKSASAVRDFLGKVRDAAKPAARAELNAFAVEHARLGGKATDRLSPPDFPYLQDRVRARAYHFNGQELSEYLEVSAVTRGLLELTARMYQLAFREVPANAWHPDVRAFEVASKGDGKQIGKFYLDLHPRPGKYKHAAMFTVRSARRREDGGWVEPMAALVCNFPKPGAQPALMQHGDVVTFFHEFGHVLHQLLTRSELATYSGANTVRDFVEAPSQMFEEWAWSREVLDMFARHHQSGAKIPDALFARMQKSRKLGRALSTQRQLVFARLDFEYHARPRPFDTTEVYEEVQNQTDSFAYVKGTHPQSSFGHLVGYEGAYYSYQWALAIARDVLTRFKKDGLLDPRATLAWREEVLSKGGGVDEATMVQRFLGRPTSVDAYLAYLRGLE